MQYLPYPYTVRVRSTADMLFFPLLQERRLLSHHYIHLCVQILCLGCYILSNFYPAIALYEYFLTFVSEVERFWTGGSLNWATGLFYANRYLVLFGHIPVMIEYFWSTSNPEKITVGIHPSSFESSSHETYVLHHADVS